MNVNNRKLNIALVGTYPPPYGGVSVHILRMKDRLEKQGYNCVVYDLRKQFSSAKGVITIRHPGIWLLKYAFSAKEDIIHFHSSDWRIYAIAGLMGLFGKKVIITIHNSRLSDSLKALFWLKRKIVVFAFRHISFIIAVNSKIKEFLLQLGIKPENIAVIPAFIPPVVKDEDIRKVPQEIWRFIDEHKPIISGNAFRIAFYNNQDLYGIDMCINLCANLKKYYPNIGFVFALPDIRNYDYFNKMKQEIKRQNIEGNFLFQTKPCPFYPILLKSDVFVRPTNTDGASVSIAEAIYFKVPVVASDIVKRIEGTIVFKNRDGNDFTSKVKNVLENYGEYKKKLKVVESKDNFGKVLEVYKHLLTQSRK